MSNAATIKASREAAGLSAREAGALVGVTTVTWQRWEGQSSRATEIPYAHLELFLILTGQHPVFRLISKNCTGDYTGHDAENLKRSGKP